MVENISGNDSKELIQMCLKEIRIVDMVHVDGHKSSG